MRKVLVVTLFTAVWSAITIFALLWGFHYDWPDNVHTDYGLPLIWSTHTTSTFVGPADLWAVKTVNLAVDLAIWMGILTVALAFLTWKLQDVNKQTEHLSK